ncbi:GntR family transcriptional regulator [Sulfitobacter sp. HNIBRBA3233]|uniref:GntR family transcriptional regulator n=1 Tax=Sulfitobacter marinivivus TaxID=3158558 RepID=UPI0032DEDE3D
MQSITQAPSRAQQVYHTIRDAICDCTLEPGKHLVQEELASTLGVSRQPIQQAMLLLKNDGLVIESGGRGLFVAPLDPVEIRHRYQIRKVLDELAGRLVARQAKRSSGFRDRILREGQDLLEQGEKTRKKGNALETVGVDMEFHQFIYSQSGNPLIASTTEPHWYFLRRVMVAVLLHAERGHTVWDQHCKILDALVSGDEDESARLARQHIEGAEEALIAALEKRSPPKDAAE